MGKGGNNKCARQAVSMSANGGMDVGSVSGATATLAAPDRPCDYNSRQLNYEYVVDQAGVQECLAALSHPDVKVVALDIETTAIQPWQGTIRLVQLAVEEPEPRQFVLDLWDCDSQEVLNMLQDPSLSIITTNGKFEQRWLKYHYGIELANPYDVCYASRVIGNSRKRKVKDPKTGRWVTKGPKVLHDFRLLMRRYVNKRISKNQQKSDWGAEELSEAQLRYAAMDVAGLMDIYRGLRRDVEERGLQEEVQRQGDIEFERALVSIDATQDIYDANDEGDDLIRRMSCADSMEELESFYALRRRYSLHHISRQQVDVFYAQRRAELSSAPTEEPAYALAA